MFYFSPRPSLSNSSLISSIRATLGLVLLSCVPWHLRFTAQPFLVVHLAQLLDFVAQFLDPFANFFRPWSPVSHCHGQLIFTEITDDFCSILQNQSTKLQRSHRRPSPTTDEGLPQRSQLVRLAGLRRASRCDLWRERYLRPLCCQRLSLFRLAVWSLSQC